MKNKIIIVIVLIVLVVSVIMIGNSKPKNDIKIGATLPLTGPLAFIGQAYKNGLTLAVEEINKNGGVDGKKITLVNEDNQGQPNVAVTNVQKLLANDKSSMILSVFTAPTQAIAGVLADAKVPMLYYSTLATIAEGNDLFFRDYFDSKDLGRSLGNYMVKDGVKKIAYLGEKSDACEDYYLEAKKTILESGKGIIAVEERFTPESTDFRTSLLKIKDSKPDGIISCTWRKSDIFMKQLKELGMLNIKTYQEVSPFLPNGDTDEIRGLYQENGTISTWYGFINGSMNESQKMFRDKYFARFNQEPISDSAFAYDDMFLISKIMGACTKADGILDSDCFSKTLVKSENIGVSGKLYFNDKGVSKRESLLMKVVDGKWVKAE
jgi:branched-chain amino acid transport system substrate-binding protein